MLQRVNSSPGLDYSLINRSDSSDHLDPGVREPIRLYKEMTEVRDELRRHLVPLDPADRLPGRVRRLP